jgi:beta-glucosidase
LFLFEADAGVASAMESFSDINGQPVPTSEFYVEDLLRKHVGFKGLIVTDWGDVWRLYQDHQTAKDPYDATWQTIKNTSLDISMVPDNGNFSEALFHLVETGRIPESRIDESAARILQLKKDVGLFEQPYADKALHSTVGSKQDVELAINTARESVTLLKNKDDVLPLKKDQKVVVVGPTGNSISYQNGGWSLRWQGSLGNEDFYGGRGITIVDGIEKVTGTRPEYIRGPDVEGQWTQEERDQVVAAVKDAEKVIVALGENTYAEFGGNIDDLTLPAGQLELVRLIKEASKAEIITVLVQVRPRSLKDIPELSSAILNAYLPGSWGGLAIAEIIFGQTNPSGRLPFTYPKHGSQSSVTYWQGIYNYFNINGGEESYYAPEFAFGTGLGYSKISYSDVELSSSTLELDGSSLEVSIKVKNEGPLPAKEPVLLYVTQQIRPGYTPDAFRLRAFDKVDLAVGEEKTVKFELSKKDVEYYKRDLKKHSDEGVNFTITINAFQGNARKAKFSTGGAYEFTR